MDLEQRISAFISLGRTIQNAIENNEQNADFAKTLSRAEAKNPWFSPTYTTLALSEIAEFLEEKQFRSWVSKFSFRESKPQRIAVITEGKTPFDSFPDILGVLISGNILAVKPSDSDSILISYLLLELISIEPQFTNNIEIHNGLLTQFDAIITPKTNGSFERYLQKYPHIIRDEQTSIAILHGDESDEDLKLLGNDIFTNYGLSKRNVTKIYMPDSFDEKKILDALEPYNYVTMHYKYMNNYEYNKSIYLVAQQTHLDNGFLILKEDVRLKSPLAVVFYEKYSDISQVQKTVENQKENIQYIVSNKDLFYKKCIPFGSTQQIDIEEYNKTIEFITNLTIL